MWNKFLSHWTCNSYELLNFPKQSTPCPLSLKMREKKLKSCKSLLSLFRRGMHCQYYITFIFSEQRGVFLIIKWIFWKLLYSKINYGTKWIVRLIGLEFELAPPFPQTPFIPHTSIASSSLFLRHSTIVKICNLSTLIVPFYVRKHSIYIYCAFLTVISSHKNVTFPNYSKVFHRRALRWN